MALSLVQVKTLAIVMALVVFLLNKIILGRVRTEQVCPKCEGSGQEFEEPCPTCKGKGTENKTVKLEVTVPGVDNEQQVRLAGEGSPGINGGPQTYMWCSELNHPIRLNVMETISTII